MRGVFLHQQLEYRLEVNGDSFHQGQPVPCTLSVKNHGTAPVSLTDLRLDLACGDVKAVKEKKPDSFEVVSSAECPALNDIPPQQQQSLAWTFQLDKNCPISEKSQSLYLLFGSAALGTGIGQLPLTVEAHPYMRAVLRSLETTFQFLLKSEKSSHGWMQAKLKSPAGHRFSTVNELLLGFRFDGESLELKYVFNVNRFQASAGEVGVKKAKTEVAQRLEPSEYLLTGGYLNHELIEARIDEALKVVETKL